ncbi:hypothetical protein ACJMK2_012761 [Sinanodonta woodiana]|uniref:Uncharacterized protein n=1 Tax=Sinanodonta woodiana TaxID=1069815 RepID=A0ABD3V985_SINWO
MMVPASSNGNKCSHNGHEAVTGQMKHKHQVKRVTPLVHPGSKTLRYSDRTVEVGKPMHEGEDNVSRIDRDIESLNLPVSWNGTNKHQNGRKLKTETYMQTSNRTDHKNQVGAEKYPTDRYLNIEMFPIIRSGKTTILEEHEVNVCNKMCKNDHHQINAGAFRGSCSGNKIYHNDHTVKSVMIPDSWNGNINYQNVCKPWTSFIAYSGKPSNRSNREVKTWTSFPDIMSGVINYQNVFNVKTYTTHVARNGETSNHNFSDVKTLRPPLSWNGVNIYQKNHSIKAEIPVYWTDQFRNKKGTVSTSRKLEPFSKSVQNMHSEEAHRAPFENKRNHVQSCKCVYKMNPVEYEEHVENLKNKLLAYSDSCY